MPTEPTYTKFLEPNVLLVGAPLIDLVIPVSEAFIHGLSGKKGGMETINEDEFAALLQKAGHFQNQTSGGSAANVAKVLAHLGTNCSFAGKLGKDQAGQFFLQSLLHLNITSYCTFGSKPTGHVFCFVTPDAQRTCRSFLGASQEFTAEDLHLSFFQKKTLIHIEGYSLLKPGFTEQAIQYAKENGLKVSFDLGSFEVVESNKKLIYSLLPSIDILFGNEEEFRSLTSLNAAESCEALKEITGLAIVFQGSLGSIIGASGQEILRQSAFKVKAVDTTGAGDFFEGGFLHALLRNKPIAECAHLGSFCAAEAVQVFGASLPSEAWERIRKLAS